MASDNAHLLQTLEDFKRELAQKLEDLRSLLLLVNSLEERVGATKSSLQDYIASTPSQSSGPIASGAGPRSNGQAIRPDTFLGEPPLEAAKRYLQSIGHAVHIDEIVDAVQRGGAAIKGADWRDKLEMSLIRSVFDVVKVQDKTFGLTSFYSDEQIRRLRGARARPEPLKKKKRPKAAKQARKLLAEKATPAGDEKNGASSD